MKYQTIQHPVTSGYSRCRGFTLLEILVAVTVFVVMSVFALTGIKSILDAKEVTDQQAETLAELQSSLQMLEQDISYTVDRSIRDEYGATQPPVLAGNTGITGLSLTRTGIRNPQLKNRSSMVRIRYHLQDEQLIRTRYLALDNADPNAAFDQILLKDIDQIDFRFLNADNEWTDFWPPLSSNPGQTSHLPLGIEVTLHHKQWGEIKRLLMVPGN